MKKQFVYVMMFLIFILCLVPAPIPAAEKYPAKPIIFIVSTEAGSGADTLARKLCEKLQIQLDQPIIVTNKPGAGSSIAAREVYNAKPDGYTIGMATGTIALNKLQGLLPYDYHSYTILGTYLNWAPSVMASTKSKHPFNTLQEVISFGKSRPGEINFSTGSVGQVWWVAAMFVLEATGIQCNVIPTTATGAATTVQLAGGHADIGVIDVTAAKSQMDAGNIRQLAFMGTERLKKYPDIPTMKELGFDATINSPHTAIAPPNMPKEITEKLRKAMGAAANDPEFKTFVSNNNGIPCFYTPEESVRWLDEQRKFYRAAMDKAGILKEK